MHARVSTFEGQQSASDLRREAEETVLPAATQMKGFGGMLLLADAESGKSIAVTLWESEDAMRESEEAANRLRDDASAATGGRIASVERFEVVLDTRG